MIRVASNMIPDALINSVTRLNLRQQQLQNQAATGLRVQNPEDDPTAMRRVLDLQAEASSIAQYEQNIAQLKDQSTASYNAMQSLKTISDRAGEIATQADSTKSSQDLATYAAEVTQLIQEAAQIMNSKYQGDYLFGGTLSDRAPFVLATNADGQVTSVTYEGNTSVAQAEIAEGVTLSAVPVGANSSGTGPQGLITDSRTGADFFNHLISLQNNLLAGNTAAINGTDLPALQNDEENIISQIATTGALQARMDAANNIAQNRAASLDKLISSQADADMATVMVQLSETQTAYQAALASGAKLLNLSLLDYLT
ncbi:MAG TPA: flagellin [Verrucomicrobiae bacterium]|nr:flagellin [Verrucomicrobiae bacterium]